MVCVVLVDGCNIVVIVVGIDFEIDFVLFYVEFLDLFIIILVNIDNLRVGDVVLVMGNFFNVG